MTALTETILSVSIVGGALAIDHRAHVRLLVSQPICGGLLTGLVLGDWRAGFLAGSILQMMFLGAIPVRGAQLPDLPLGGVVASALYILSQRGMDGDGGARGFALACSIAAGLAVAVAGRSAMKWWEGRSDAFAEAARRNVEKDRWWAASAIHFSALFFHFAFGFVVAALATAALVPLIAAAGTSIAGGWSEQLGSLGTLLPFIGAGTLAAANFSRTRLFWFIAGFACVMLVLFFRG